MNPPIIEQQIEDSLNSLFGNEESLGGHKPVYASDSSLLKNEPEVMFSEKANAFFKILKMVFLFLPGAFFLYFSSIFFLYAFFVTKTSILDFGFGLALWALSVFMLYSASERLKTSNVY